MVTCPSAISTALLSLRTHRTVVPCISALPWLLRILSLYSGGAGPGHARHAKPAKVRGPRSCGVGLSASKREAAGAVRVESLLESSHETFAGDPEVLSHPFAMSPDLR